MFINKKIYLFLFFLINQLFLVQAQNHIVLSGGQAKLIGGKLVVKDANFKNRGTFAASAGIVEMTGTATTNNSQIQGNTTTFYNLEIDKSGNDASLATNIIINNQLIFTNGKLDIGNSNTTIQNAASIQTPTASKYVKTSGIGVLTQTVGNTNVQFPIGNASYNPVTINNAGTSDTYSVRVSDDVLADGTTGTAFTEDAVDRTWHISETHVGGSDLTLTVQWNSAEELSNFARAFGAIYHYPGGTWTSATANGISGSDPYMVARSNVTSLSPFSVQEGTVTVNVMIAPISVIENSGSQLEYTFTRTGPTVGSLTVNFEIDFTNSTATYNTDYTISGETTFNTSSGIGTMTIPDGVSTKKLIIIPTGDLKAELNETVVVKLLAG